MAATPNTIGYVKAGNTDLAVAVDTSNNAIDLDQSVLISAEGNQTVISNLNQAALSHGLNGYQIQPGSSISLRGASGSFAKFALGSSSPVSGTVNGVFLIAGSGGQVYYTPLGTGGSTYTGCARMKNLTSYQVYLAGGGTITNMEMAGASELYVDDTAITNLYQDSGSSSLNYYSTGLTSAIVGGGSLVCGRSCTTLTIGGNAQVVFSRTDSNSTPPTATTINIYSGTLKWRGGDITTLNAYGTATCDFSDVPAAMTIGTLNTTAAVTARSYFKGKSFTVTISSTNVRCGLQDTIQQ